MRFESVNVNMSVDEAAQVKALMNRDTAMPAIEKEYTYEGANGEKYYACPVCENNLGRGKANFCEVCGQRIDNQNVAL